MCHIYKIVNAVNNKVYIGQTIRDIDERLRLHVWDAISGRASCRKLANAIRKYGADEFSIVSLVSVLSEEYLDELEMMLIAEYDSVSTGYNITFGGGGMRGYVTSQETKLKLSLINTGLKRTDETKRNISLARTGLKNTKKYSSEVLARKSENLKGSKNPMYGKKLSDDHKRKLSESLLGENSPFFNIPKSEEVKSKLRNNQPHVKKVCLDGVIYDSMRLAEKESGITRATISRWIAKNNGRAKLLDTTQETSDNTQNNQGL